MKKKQYCLKTKNKKGKYMNLISVIFIGLALAMDAFAVSIAGGIIEKKKRIKNAFFVSFMFGFFQMLMPIIGWSLGFKFRQSIVSYDHWIAFTLLFAIGAKMIYEGLKIVEVEEKALSFTVNAVLILSIATSIDALAAGLSFACLDISILTPALIIGFITFLICLIGFFIGARFGHLFENKVELFGGIILILIGFKILITHLLNISI